VKGNVVNDLNARRGTSTFNPNKLSQAKSILSEGINSRALVYKSKNVKDKNERDHPLTS